MKNIARNAFYLSCFTIEAVAISTRIPCVQFVHKLCFCFHLQSNRLVKIENLEGLIQLEQLYVSDNGIERIEGLEQLVNTCYNLAFSEISCAKSLFDSTCLVCHSCFAWACICACISNFSVVCANLHVMM